MNLGKQGKQNTLSILEKLDSLRFNAILLPIFCLERHGNIMLQTHPCASQLHVLMSFNRTSARWDKISWKVP